MQSTKLTASVSRHSWGCAIDMEGGRSLGMKDACGMAECSHVWAVLEMARACPGRVSDHSLDWRLGQDGPRYQGRVQHVSPPSPRWASRANASSKSVV